ncbi:MAG: glycine cleavage system aminomethyltransferase GcvT [Candidatus Zixiibacteriota bacterium]|nr:MAG: glycine cleavage system aminomethyltransferase GcvT [candidate division Zixibacteria bacterium]HDL04224.1 glycine cleavage system aminomethyltransferase GcvT [candidate division Zixibacteria bacterium]
MEVEQPDREPKKTPFYKYHIEAGAKMVPFAGYIMPIQYAGITKEHLAVRKNVGMFDISHMGEFDISGPDALAFIQKMTVNDASKLEVGQIQYSCMCYDDGGIVDDLLVYRLEDRFMLVVNAANLDKDFKWLESHLEGDVKLVNRSDDYGLLAIQGPVAQKVVEEMCDYDLESMPYYTSAGTNIAGHDVLFSRTGYTGEDGFELYITTHAADDVWAAAIEAGRKYNMQLIGLGARDSLRLEMKMALYGNDIDKTTNPIEAGLAWIVNFNKGDFIAREILEKEKKEKPKRRLICLELEGRAFPRHGYDLVSNGEVIGQVTSGTFSPSLQKPIAMGYLPLKLTRLGNQVDVKIRDKLYPATVVKPPFYKEATHR